MLRSHGNSVVRSNGKLAAKSHSNLVVKSISVPDTKSIRRKVVKPRKLPKDKVWWFCHRCKYNWIGIRPSLRQRKPKCPKCGYFPVVPGYGSKKWSQVRSEILKRDGYKCQKCGSTKNLQVHHIVRVVDGGESDPDNLITLCEKCHRKEHFGSNIWIIILIILFLLMLLFD